MKGMEHLESNVSSLNLTIIRQHSSERHPTTIASVIMTSLGRSLLQRLNIPATDAYVNVHELKDPSVFQKTTTEEERNFSGPFPSQPESFPSPLSEVLFSNSSAKLVFKRGGSWRNWRGKMLIVIAGAAKMPDRGEDRFCAGADKELTALWQWPIFRNFVFYGFRSGLTRRLQTHKWLVA